MLLRRVAVLNQGFEPPNIGGRNGERFSSAHRADSHVEPRIGNPIRDSKVRFDPLEHVELSQRHWDLIDYLRDEYFNNNQSTPNTRAILKAMGERWGERVEQKALYDLLPLDPSKQGGRIAGQPESKRKGGY